MVRVPDPIPPGGEETLTLRINTSGYGGYPLRKEARVFAKGSEKPFLKLTVSGRVESFVSIQPRRAVLRGSADRQPRATIEIVPRDRYPFRLIGPDRHEGRNFRYRVETAERSGRPVYRLHVENVKPEGHYEDVIVLRTDSPVHPRITVPVFGRISIQYKAREH